MNPSLGTALTENGDAVRDALYRKVMLGFLPLLCLCLIAASESYQFTDQRFTIEWRISVQAGNRDWHQCVTRTVSRIAAVNHR